MRRISIFTINGSTADQGIRLSTRGTKVCPCCQQRQIEYGHMLNEGLVRALFKTYQLARTAPTHLNEVGLDHNQLANFQKLQYWGLAEMSPHNGRRRRGWWRVTPAGEEFLRLNRTVARKVWTYRGAVTSFDHGEQVGPLNVWDGYELPEAWGAGTKDHGESAQGKLTLDC